MKLLVTGALGFIGSSLTESLLHRGDHVQAISRSNNGFLRTNLLQHENLSLKNIDLGKEELISIDGDYDALINLVSQQPNREHVDWKDYYSSNVEAAKSICLFAKDRGIKQVISISTTSVYPISKDERLTEVSRLQPSNIYGYSKALGEDVIKRFSISSGSDIQFTIIRFPSVFGKNHLGGIVHTIFNLAQQSSDIEIYDNGDKYRNLLYISDAVNIIRESIDKKKDLNNFEVFLAGSHDSIKMIDIVKKIVKRTNSTSKIIPVSKSSNNGNIFLDLKKLNTVLGYYTMTIEEGIDLYVKAMTDEI